MYNVPGGPGLGHSGHGAGQDVPLGVWSCCSGGEHNDSHRVTLLVWVNPAYRCSDNNHRGGHSSSAAVIHSTLLTTTAFIMIDKYKLMLYYSTHVEVKVRHGLGNNIRGAIYRSQNSIN